MTLLKNDKKGFILLSIILASLVFVIIILPLIGWTINEFAWTTRYFNVLRALNLADAGAERGTWEIIHNDAQFTGWTGGNPKTKELSSFQDSSGETIGDIYVSADETSSEHYLITSTGYVPDKADPAMTRTVKVRVFPHALFNNGVFGFGSVSMSGNALVDSYDSEVAPYDPATAGDNGDVGTNGTLTLLENSSINADIFIGPNGSTSGVTSTNVSGTKYVMGNEVEGWQSQDVSELIVLPSLGNLALSGSDNVTLPSGDYRYESISLEGKAELHIGANTRLYCHNDFYIGGQAAVYTDDNVKIYLGGNGTFAGQGIVNLTGNPGNLQMYGVRPGANWSFTGINDFYGSVYAPDSSVYMAGEAGYYGAIVGGNVELAGNVQLHYDERLSREGPFIGYDVVYWQEG